MTPTISLTLAIPTSYSFLPEPYLYTLHSSLSLPPILTAAALSYSSPYIYQTLRRDYLAHFPTNIHPHGGSYPQLFTKHYGGTIIPILPTVYQTLRRHRYTSHRWLTTLAYAWRGHVYLTLQHTLASTISHTAFFTEALRA